ncbi:MAG TPA: cysteine desulfurase family protein [Roseiflexaceae bacterium]|nr:cysteine desulfurase family protein [Roseiflexaceae bacterium]
MSDRYIYLDHAATTPVDEQVLAAMLPYFSAKPGNPSSIHQAGRAALEALDDARETVAAVLGASRKEIVFTGGGSEADNLAIKGVVLAQRQAGKGAHVITSAIEHHAVLHAVDYLEAFGFETTVLPVDADGLVRPDDLRAAIRPDTVLASIMYANNEIGTIQPLAELGAICHERGVPLHTDAVQAAGSLALDVDALNVDLLTLAAHKFYGPKGIGALYVRRGTPLLPQINGGGQERRRRAGTENVPGIVGMATALRLAEERRESYAASCMTLRDQLIAGVLGRIPYSSLNGHPSRRLPNNANFAFEFVEGESVLLLLDQQGIAASSGSACTSGSLEASHVLTALGLPYERAIGSVRFTNGKATTAGDIDYLLDILPPLIERLRSVSPGYRERELQTA